MGLLSVVLLAVGSCNGFTHQSARPALSGLKATVTSVAEMFAASRAVLDLATTEVTGDGIRFTQFSSEASAGEALLYIPGIEFRGISSGAQSPTSVLVSKPFGVD
jgi:hypothetical protein